MKVFERKRKKLAGTTGLEPATSDVTGRRSNQLSYVPLLYSPKNVGHSQNTIADASTNRILTIPL